MGWDQPPVSNDTNPVVQIGNNSSIDSSQYWQPPQARNMTYSAMRNAMQAAQQGGTDNGYPSGVAADGRLVPPNNSGETNGLLAGFRDRQQRGFQPQFVGQQRRDQPQQPPGAPQEQPRQGILRRVFRGEQPQTPAARGPVQKIEFNAANETGVVGEISLPAAFREVPKDPATAGEADPIRREYRIANSRSRVSFYEGRELSADEQKLFGDLLKKPGRIAANTQQFDDACALIGAGYHSFYNDAQMTVGKFNGRDALFLTDEDPRTKVVGYTVLVPSDTGKFIYAISFDGNKSDFPQVKQSMDTTIKWRRTPDAVAPPAPGPRRP